MSTAGIEETTTAGNDSIADAVLQAVADHEDTMPTALEPALYDVINPDALNTLFALTEAGDTRTAGHVVFAHCGYKVTVYSDGHVTADAIAEDHGAQSNPLTSEE